MAVGGGGLRRPFALQHSGTEAPGDVTARRLPCRLCPRCGPSTGPTLAVAVRQCVAGYYGLYISIEIHALVMCDEAWCHW